MTIYTALYLFLSLVTLFGLLTGLGREFSAMEDKWAASGDPHPLKTVHAEFE